MTSIALACGYRSLNLFTVDFQQRFHVKPSELLRESTLAAARSGRPGRAWAAAPQRGLIS